MFRLLEPYVPTDCETLDSASAWIAPSLATRRSRMMFERVDPMVIGGFADGGLAADELEPSLVLRRRQEPLGLRAQPVAATLELGHDQTLLLGSATRADVV
jgi:hypothetical protein